jgi:hypothetical protein
MPESLTIDSANNAVYAAIAVTDHQLGNSSLILSTHEQTEIISDEGE